MSIQVLTDEDILNMHSGGRVPLTYNNNSKLNPQTSAAILVDMQEDFLKGFDLSNIDTQYSRTRIDDVIQNQYDFITELFNKRVKIYIVNSVSQGGKNPSLMNKKLDELRVRLNLPTVIKNSDPAYNSELERMLKENRITDLIYMGINSGSCVYQGAEAAASKFNIFTAKDILEDSDKYNDKGMKSKFSDDYDGTQRFNRIGKCFESYKDIVDLF